MGDSSIKKRILVADDNEAVRIMLEDILQEAGYEVLTAIDGQETQDFLKKQKFDLVILDLLMPKMSGFEILEWLQTQPKKPSVMVLTGIFRSKKEIERLRQLGAKGYIYKSAPVEEILYRVNKVLFPVESDTRKYPRIPVNINIEYKLDSKWVQAYSSTLGGNGMFIRTVNPPREGVSITVKFTIPETDKQVQVEGRVAWSNEYEMHSKKTSFPGMGVEFKNLDETTRRELLKYIEEQLAKDHIW